MLYSQCVCVVVWVSHVIYFSSVRSTAWSTWAKSWTYGSMLKDNGANRGYKHVVHPYNRASMLRHCLHALTVCHGSSLANEMCVNRDPHREIFGKWVKGRSCRAPFFLRAFFPEVFHLRLRGHGRCLFITAIMIMKYYRYFFMLLRYGVSLVVKGCFESGRRSIAFSHVKTREDSSVLISRDEVGKDLERERNSLQLRSHCGAEGTWVHGTGW